MMIHRRIFLDGCVAGLLLLIACGLFGHRYWTPESLFWDENYHVASAQKHIDGVMFMEPHPPLGKMLIALGEALTGANANRDTSALLTTDHVQQQALPEAYSFTGVRLASVVSMALVVPLFYALLMLLTGQRLLAAVFASLPMLDTAMLVHTRAAMLEGIQFLFVMAALCWLAWCVRRPSTILLRHYAVLGLLTGLVISIKVNGAVLLLLPVALFLTDRWQAMREAHWAKVATRLATTVPCFCLPLLLVFFGSFYLHISTATEIMPGRLYKASPEYVAHLHQGTTWTPSGFIVGMRDHWRYMSEYADGVPRLDVCKPGENGSRAIGWPLGAKTINYRWSRQLINGESRVDYTYLVPNPLIWWPVLAGILLSAALITSRAVFGLRPGDLQSFNWQLLFTSLYLAYMITMLQIERVMYLYHYLLPLLFGMANLACLWNYLFKDGLTAGHWHPRANLLAFLALVVVAFCYFAPFVYGWPLSALEVEQRNWLSLWRLEPAP